MFWIHEVFGFSSKSRSHQKDKWMYSCFMKCLWTCDNRCVGLRNWQTWRLRCSVSSGFTQPCHSCSAGFVGVSLVAPLGKEPCVLLVIQQILPEFKQQMQGWFSPFHVCDHLCLVCSPQQHQWLKALYLPLFCYLVLSSCVPDTTSLGCGSFRPSINKNHWTSLFLIAV